MDPSDEKKKSEETKNLTKPEWYEVLMKESFRGNCIIHPGRQRDVFCFFCHNVICCDCVNPHHSHPLVQVTNLLGDDAVWLDYISKFIDCSQIQTYEIDEEKLILLKRKHDLKSAEECKKLIQEPFEFCSLSCKVDHLLDHEEDLSHICNLEEFRSESSEDDQTVLNSGSDPNDQDIPNRHFSAGTSRIMDPPASASDQNTPEQYSADTNHRTGQLVGYEDQKTPNSGSTGINQLQTTEQLDQFVDQTAPHPIPARPLARGNNAPQLSAQMVLQNSDPPDGQGIMNQKP